MKVSVPPRSCVSGLAAPVHSLGQLPSHPLLLHHYLDPLPRVPKPATHSKDAETLYAAKQEPDICDECMQAMSCLAVQYSACSMPMLSWQYAK